MFNWISNRSIGLKFIITVVTILFITTSLISYIYIQANYNFQIDSLLTKGKSLGRFVSLISPQSVLSYDFEGMNDFMREIAEEEDIVYGVIVSQNGKNLTQYLNKSNPYIGSVLEELKNSKDVLQIIDKVNTHDEVIPLEFPIIFNQQPLAKLILGVSQDRVDRNYNNVITDVLITMTFIIGILSTLIYIGFRYMTVIPIKNLRTGLQRVASGDLEKTIAQHSNDEIGQLTQSFNVMLVKLKQSIREKDNQSHELAVLNQSLEDRVEEGVRIMRDLHDDVGANLLTLVHRSESDENANIARKALHHLRETLRGLGNKQTTVHVSDALADWHDEARERLDAANIKLDWQQPDEYSDISFNNRQLINLSRIVREGISNAIKHANPSIINICISIDNNFLTLVMCDDGAESIPEKWDAGTGINNMQTRSKELNATLKWYRKQRTCGICLEVNCPIAMEK